MSDSKLYPRNTREPLFERFRDRDRTVTAAGAPDPYREIRLSFRRVLRHQEPQQVQRPIQELPRRLGLVEKLPDLAVAPGMRPQVGDEVRVGQEPDIEQQVRIDGNAVLEPEAQDRDDQLRPRRGATVRGAPRSRSRCAARTSSGWRVLPSATSW